MKTFRLACERDRERIHLAIDELEADGKKKIEIKEVGSKRSTAQNNLYQVWTRCMAKDLGYSHEEMKEVLVRAHLTPVIVQDLKGNNIEVWPSTTKLKVKEFAEFLNMIELDAGMAGIRLDKSTDDYRMAQGERL